LVLIHRLLRLTNLYQPEGKQKMNTPKGLLPDFEEDIFINYDHDDNKALTDLRGWVDLMHESLETRLAMLVGEKPKIWRDNLMTGNQLLTDTIVVRLSKTAFLVSVLSPSYINSPWCKRELNEFYLRASLNGGIKLNNKSRIFKVVKTPIGDNDPRIDPLEGSDLPPELRALLQESLGYNFFELDDKGRPIEFWPELGKEFRQKFLTRLEDLAQDIKEFIFKCQKPACDQLVPGEQSVASDQDCKKNRIYLAETTPELFEDRNEIKRTLQQHNYHVLPDENLPFESPAFDEKVRSYLEQSALSIHLIGSDHTSIAACDPQTQVSLNFQHQLAGVRVRKQHELAMSRADNDPEYSRLIWMPAGLTGQDPSYQEFIEYLQNDPAVYENAEVLYGANLEDLKTIVQKRLKFSREENIGKGKGKRVYLICDKQDMEAALPLQTFLNRQKFEVMLPFKAGGQVVSGHKENLRLCDAVLIFYGSTNTMEWKLKDLRRIDVFRDNRPLLAKGIYVAGPETDQKRAFDTIEALVMKNFGEFSLESLSPFLKQVETIAPFAKGAPV
jgi:hypothetical protein